MFGPMHYDIIMTVVVTKEKRKVYAVRRYNGGCGNEITMVRSILSDPAKRHRDAISKHPIVCVFCEPDMALVSNRTQLQELSS